MSWKLIIVAASAVAAFAVGLGAQAGIPDPQVLARIEAALN